MNRILFVIPSLGTGGAERQLVRLIKGINLSKSEIHLCVLKQGGLFENNLPENIRRVNLNNYKNLPASIFTLKKYIKKNCISHVHTFLPLASFYIFLSLLFMRKRPRFIISIRSQITSFIKRNFYLNQFSFILADHIIVNSKAVMANTLRLFYVKSEKVRLIYNGINSSKYSEGESKSIKHTNFTLLFLGRLNRKKGVLVLLEIIEKLADRENIRYIIVGKGPLEKKMMSSIEQVGMGKRVDYINETNDVVSYFSKSDLFILPTFLEGLSNSVMESMAAGVPVVTTDIPSNKELITNGVEGFLVPVNNSSAFVEKIDFILNNRSIIPEIVEKAREKIKTGFSEVSMVEKYLRLYKH